MSKLKPLNGHVVLRPVETSEDMVGNIILPDMGKERPESGEVVAISNAWNYHTDKEVPSNLNVGDIVLIPKLGSMSVKLEGQDYYITRETEILAIIN